MNQRIVSSNGTERFRPRRHRSLHECGKRARRTNRILSTKGTVCGDLISFTVNWEEAITTWTGHGILANGKRRILTLWHLIQTIPDETDPQQQWRTVLSGADEFDPVG